MDGDVAQLVEQRTENPCVGGSIPSITTPKPTLATRWVFLCSTTNQACLNELDAQKNHARSAVGLGSKAHPLWNRDSNSKLA
jgi:hypothetical protein